MTRLAVPAAVLFRELGGESVVLNLVSESYFGLDEIGTDMWFALVEHSSVDAAVEPLLDRYDVDRATLERDLLGLAETLIRHGLLEPTDA
jgi:hypothetical protein